MADTNTGGKKAEINQTPHTPPGMPPANQEPKLKKKSAFLPLVNRLFPKKEHVSDEHRTRKANQYFNQAGMLWQYETITVLIFRLTVFVNLILSFYLLYRFGKHYYVNLQSVLVFMILVWILVFILLLCFLWILFYVMIDLKIYKRKVSIEDVLPDFLQLAASNIKAGMTIDHALWFAIRPRFGVLAKEIETVAKETMTGVDLKDSLRRFANKYESPLLKRTINMLIEGLEAGGEIGDLLNKIASNLKDQKLLMKEVAAGVTTYVIFITFAAIVAAPVLFALSGSLISVIQSIGGTLESSGGAGSFALTFSSDAIKITDFKIFAVVSLFVSATFSAMMISTIKKGNIKAGIKYIPIFIITSLTIYYFAVKISTAVIGQVF